MVMSHGGVSCELFFYYSQALLLRCFDIDVTVVVVDLVVCFCCCGAARPHSGQQPHDSS